MRTALRRKVLPLRAVKLAAKFCGHMKKLSETSRTVEMYKLCPRFVVAPGMTR